MNIENLQLLLVFSLVFAGGLFAVGTSIVNERTRQKRLGQRIDTITQRHETRRTIAPLRITRAEGPGQKGWFRQVLGVFGVDPVYARHYPLPWYVVLLITLGIGRIATGLLMPIAGDYAYVVMPIAWIGLSRSFFASIDDKRRQILRSQFPDALAMIVRSVRVGVPVTEAMRHVAVQSPQPTGGEFTQLADDLSIGTPLDRALRAMAERSGLAEYQFFATALTLQAQTGGALSETLENLADVIRKRIALRARGYALSAEARTSIMVLGALPFIAGFTIGILNPAFMLPLILESFGRRLISVGFVLLATGILTMQALIRSNLR